MVHLFLGHQSYPDNYRDVKNVTINIHRTKLHRSLQLSTSQADSFHDICLLFNKKVGNILRLNCRDICTLQDARTNYFTGHLGSAKKKERKDYLARGSGDMGGIKRHVGNFLRLLDILTWQDGEAWKGCWLSKKTPVSQAKNDYQPKQGIPLDRVHPLGPLNLFYLVVPATNTVNFH